MTPENIYILQKHLHHFFTLEKAQYLKGLNHHEINDLLSVARKDFFGERYNPDVWCGSCLAEMVRSIYNAFKGFLKQATGDNLEYKDSHDAIEAMLIIYNKPKNK